MAARWRCATHEQGVEAGGGEMGAPPSLRHEACLAITPQYGEQSRAAHSRRGRAATDRRLSRWAADQRGGARHVAGEDITRVLSTDRWARAHLSVRTAAYGARGRGNVATCVLVPACLFQLRAL
jgi:hypothetical protein